MKDFIIVIIININCYYLLSLFGKLINRTNAHLNDFRIAVRFARVIDEPRRVTHDGRIYDVVQIFSEHVATDAAGLVSPLPLIRQVSPDDLRGEKV